MLWIELEFKDMMEKNGLELEGFEFVVYYLINKVEFVRYFYFNF